MSRQSRSDPERGAPGPFERKDTLGQLERRETGVQIDGGRVAMSACRPHGSVKSHSECLYAEGIMPATHSSVFFHHYFSLFIYF